MNSLSQSIILDSKSKIDKISWCKETATTFNLNYIETSNVNDVAFSDITVPSLIVLTNDILDIKQQNILLKTIEEPSAKLHYVLVCDVDCLIDTLKNRLTFIKLKEYTKEDLKKLTNDELVLTYATTPDDIELFKQIDLKKMVDISSTIMDKLELANFANSLVLKQTISDNPNVFSKIFLGTLKTSLEKSFDEKLYKYYVITNKFKMRLNSAINYNVDSLIYKYVVELWGVTHGY